jgi:hypothetical protein
MLAAEKADDAHWLLCARRERPRHGRAAEQRYELASPHVLPLGPRIRAYPMVAVSSRGVKRKCCERHQFDAPDPEPT